MSTKFRQISDEDKQEVLYSGQPPPLTLEDRIDDQAIKQFAHKKELFFQIEKSSIVENTLIDFVVFKQKLLNFIPLIEATEIHPVIIEKKQIDDIVSDNLCALAIQKKQVHLFKRYVNGLLKYNKSDAVQCPKMKAVLMRENSKIIIDEVLREPRSGERVKEIGELVIDITESIIHDEEMLFNMLSLSNYDYYTYNHCLNVAVLCIGLSILLGLKKREIRQFATGAMLHDIGKTLIAPEILNKPSRLTEIEYKTMQRHVIEGVNLLKENPSFPKDAINPVLHHHEKISGNGYPNKLRGNEIPLTSRIIAISDCYDALTTSRPYKPAFTPFQALNTISQEKTDYDPDLLLLFVKMLGKVKTKNST
ncbi:MAG: HD-GYP domain-containing protein [Thermodesulfovibrionales bacterium]|nr:HD-GYP domain-containing protein [Thermodesulfovibrionales bacterium]